MNQLNPLTTTPCPPVAIHDEAGGVAGWKNADKSVWDLDPKYRGVFPQWEVMPETQDHDFGAGAVKIVAPSDAELVAAAVAAVEAGTAPPDLVVEVAADEPA